LLPAHRERLFPPTETLSMFVAQALSEDGSCQKAVNDAMVKRVIGGLQPGSTDTGGYCKARARLPVSMISTLARDAGGIVAAGATPWWHWQSRPVRLVAGATVTLPDTEENQAAFPQPSSQKFEFHVGLLRDQSYSFSESLFKANDSRLYLLDVGTRTIVELSPTLMRELIEKAREAKHPFNLYNLLLISKSLVGLLRSCAC